MSVSEGDKRSLVSRGDEDCLLVVPSAQWSATEHAAILEHPERFEFLRRKDHLLDEEVHTIFGIISGEAHLQAIYFSACAFGRAEALRWLEERGLAPRWFVEANEITAN